MTAIKRGASIPVEVVGAWVLLFATAIGILITYARLPTAEFYNVSRSGFAGGASRALIYSNYSASFVAIALLGFAVSTLLADIQRPSGRWRMVVGAGMLSLFLCLITAGPGVVSQDDLDARPVNLVPFAGVVIAAVLTVIAVRRFGIEGWRHRRPLDRARWGAAILLLLVGLPWVLAGIGVYVGDLPLIGGAYMSKEQPPGETLRAVHLGHHHGTDGFVLALVAMFLSRSLDEVSHRRIRRALSWYLPFMLVYGLANMANDFWLEQVVKRGTVTVEIPDMLRPEFTPAWAVVLVTTVIVRAFMTSAMRGPVIPSKQRLGASPG